MAEHGQSTLDAIMGIRDYACIEIHSLLRVIMRANVMYHDLDMVDMVAVFADAPDTHKFFVFVDHKYIDYTARSLANDDMTPLEQEEDHALEIAFIDEYVAKTTALAGRVNLSSEPPVKNVDLYVSFYSYALIYEKPVLLACVKCS